jgi:hypothetical protein
MDDRAAMDDGDVNDPSATLAGSKSRSAVISCRSCGVLSSWSEAPGGCRSDGRPILLSIAASGAIDQCEYQGERTQRRNDYGQWQCARAQ